MKTQTIEQVKKEIDPDEEIVDLRNYVNTLNKRIGTLKKEYGNLKTFFRDLKEYIMPIEPEKRYYRPRKKSKVSSPVVAVIHNTDGHLGAVQLPDEIEGFGENDPDICRARQQFFFEQAIEWVDLHRASYICDEAVVIVTGDMISGDIHKELSVTNAFPVPIQVAEAGILLSDNISLIAPHFNLVRVEFIVPDNHGRLTEKIQHKQAGENSLNYLVGFIAKERLQKHKNVVFNLHTQVQKVIDVNSRQYLCTHGHQVRGWAGFPYYGIERKTGREAIKRMMTNMNRFDRIVMGHWHAPLAHPWYWIGGAVSGTDAYDHDNGRYCHPTQPAWLVHPKWGEFDRTDFDLRGAKV